MLYKIMVTLLLAVALAYAPANASTIFSLIQANDFPKVQELLAKDATAINARQDTGFTPLHMAAKIGNEALVDLLLKAGADVNKTAYFQTGMNRTPLHMAVEFMQVPVVKLLLKNKANLEARLSDGKTVLLFAASRGSFDSCQLLLEAGADLQAIDNQGNNVLHIAAGAFNSESKLLALLVAKGIKVNSINYSGLTPLAIAIQRSKNTTAAEQLIAAGADLQTRDETGANLLMLAAANARKEFVSWLMEKGADTTAKNYNGWTLLHYTVRGNQPAIADIVIKQPLDINAKDNEGRTPLLWAATANNVEMIKWLIEHRADVNIIDENGQNALQKSCYHDSATAAELLLANGVNPNNIDVQGKTALHMAVEAYIEDVSLVTLLLKSGADANIRNAEGENALDIAEMYGAEKLVELLKPLIIKEEEPE